MSNNFIGFVCPIIAKRLATFLAMREAEIGEGWPMWAVLRRHEGIYVNQTCRWASRMLNRITKTERGEVMKCFNCKKDEAEFFSAHKLDDYNFYVECGNCGAKLSQFDTTKEAEESWTSISRKVELHDELVEALERFVDGHIFDSLPTRDDAYNKAKEALKKVRGE